MPEKQCKSRKKQIIISSEYIEEVVKPVLKKSLIRLIGFSGADNWNHWGVRHYAFIWYRWESCRCVVPTRQPTRLRPHRSHKQQLLFIFNIFQTRAIDVFRHCFTDRWKDINKPTVFTPTHVIASRLKRKVYCVHPDDVCPLHSSTAGWMLIPIIYIHIEQKKIRCWQV